MKLKDKTMLFFVSIMALLVVVLTVLSAFSFRRFSIYTAERHALSVAETVKVGLTESMINGTIDKRQQFLSRLSIVPGVKQVRVVRGKAVVDQFGAGLSQEMLHLESVDAVLGSGKNYFEMLESEGDLIFRAVIPYVANDHGVPNCLQCHIVPQDTVLGAVMIDIPLSEVRGQGIIAVMLITFAVVGAVLLFLMLLRRMLNPLSETAEEVRLVTARAVDGDFSKRVKQSSTDEVGDIADNINRLLDFLEREIGTIRSRVGQLLGHQTSDGRNQLTLTTEMVDSLVEASQFKQAIEEDQTKQEIYQRLVDVLKHKYFVKRFSVYEVANSKNKMALVYVSCNESDHCRYCDPIIAIDADACRAKRTGHNVNALDYPGLCTMFRAGNEGDTHVCLPIIQSGSTGCVVQLVVNAEDAPFMRMALPFIAVYLREAGPVLEAKRLMEHLRENALRDAMTGLHNRRYLEEYVATLVAGSQRRKAPFSVLMLDLDYFKQVNDTHGHEAGDKVIKTLAELLQRNVRSSDMAVRYGGEEFLMVLLDTPADAAMQVAEKIRSEVEATKVPLASTMLQKTISIGVAEYPKDSDTFWQVVKFADVALYQAKSSGRNRVVRFSPEMWDADAHY